MENTRSNKILYGVCALAVSVAVSGAALPFGAYPFGVALLCAAGAWTPIVFGGLCIGTVLFRRSLLFIVAYALVFVLRGGISLIGKRRLTLGSIGTYIFREHLSLRAIVSAAACLCMGLFIMWRSGFLYYDLIGMIISMAASSSLVILWSSLDGTLPKSGFWYDAGLLTLSAAVIWSLRGVGAYGVELSMLVCIFVTLVSTKCRGVIFGCFEGLVCGLCVSLTYAPMFVFASVCYAFFGTLSALVGVTVAFCAVIGWGYYISGISALVSIIPSALAGALIFYIFQKIYLTRKGEVKAAEKEGETAEADRRFSELCRRLESLAEESGASTVDMRDVSEYIEKIYASRKPDQQKRILDLEIFGRSRNAKGERDFCGDSHGSFESDDKMRAAAFISDGMGSGQEAARVSGLCKMFVEKLFLLYVHSDGFFESATQMLNNFLRIENGEDECSCTLDLGVFDLGENMATFYKCGSAPTYVFRDGAIFKLRSETVPLGIFSEADIGKTQMPILPGDVFVMVSDGACEQGEQDRALADVLSSRILTHNAEQLADAVMEYAEGQGVCDDVSAVVIKVCERDLFSI